MGNEEQVEKKSRFLCLHGFRTSGDILKKQIAKWPESVLQKIDLVFVDAPFPAQGKSDVEGIFDPPFYEWFQFNKEFTEYTNFDECLAYIEDCMIRYGPFDGLLGFSQGAILSAALPGLQAMMPWVERCGPHKGTQNRISDNNWRGKAEVTLAGREGIFVSHTMPVRPLLRSYLKTLRIVAGETDFLKQYGIELLESFEDPLVIHHPKGHTVPRLDEKGLHIMLSFIERIQKVFGMKEEQEICRDGAPLA